MVRDRLPSCLILGKMLVKVTSYFTFAGDMYRRYIPQEDYFPEGLYMFDIGQNDLAGEFYSKTEDQVIASIPTILLEFETGLKVYKMYTLSSLQLSILLFPVLLIILYKAGF